MVPGRLPGLWSGDGPAGEIAVGDAIALFAGGRTVTVPKQGCEETAVIPKCPAATVEEAVSEAVAQGLLRLTNGPASLCGETVPPGVLTRDATLQAPPDPLAVSDLTAEAVPEAWRDDESTALAISAALSHEFGKSLP